MRNRPRQDHFIKAATVDRSEKILAPDYDMHVKWPILEDIGDPTMENGSTLRKPMTLPLKEYEWNTIDYHTKRLGVQKAEWIRYAIFRLLHAEQAFLHTHLPEV